MSGHQTTLPEYDCASQRCTSLTFLSTSPENLECLGSISSVLSSAVVSILGFQNVSESISSDVVTEPKSKTFNQELHLNQNFVGQARQERSSAHVVFHAESSPVDFEWLLERCDNDDELVLDVLRSFCEQGQAHITALNSEYNMAVEIGPKTERISFHAVNFHIDYIAHRLLRQLQVHIAQLHSVESCNFSLLFISFTSIVRMA